MEICLWWLNLWMSGRKRSNRWKSSDPVPSGSSWETRGKICTRKDTCNMRPRVHLLRRTAPQTHHPPGGPVTTPQILLPHGRPIMTPQNLHHRGSGMTPRILLPPGRLVMIPQILLPPGRPGMTPQNLHPHGGPGMTPQILLLPGGPGTTPRIHLPHGSICLQVYPLGGPALPHQIHPLLRGADPALPTHPCLEGLVATRTQHSTGELTTTPGTQVRVARTHYPRPRAPEPQKVLPAHMAPAQTCPLHGRSERSPTL